MDKKKHLWIKKTNVLGPTAESFTIPFNFEMGSFYKEFQWNIFLEGNPS